MRPTSADTHGSETLNATITALDQCSKTPAKQRIEKVSTHVDRICGSAFENGLSDEDLRSIIAIVTRKTFLDQTSITNLIKNLFPATKVPSDVVINVVGSLGQGAYKPTPATQSALVKWLIAVYDVLEDARVLSRMYGVLFGLLDTMNLRGLLCHLLAVITRRKHVRPFRIQRLLELSRADGNDVAISGLLRTYKDYYPDIIVGNIASGRTTMRFHRDLEWQARLHAIQEATNKDLQSVEGCQNGFKVARHGAKRSRVSVIPEVHTFHAHESSVTLEEIDNVEHLVEKLERIELPNQLVSAFQDPLLQKYLVLHSSRDASYRLELWLSRYLSEEIEALMAGSPPSPHLSEVLDGMLRFTIHNKALMQVTEDFLTTFMPLWDGTINIQATLGLLSYLPIQPFKRIYKQYLRYVEIAAMSSNSDPYNVLTSFYTGLTRYWTIQLMANDSQDGGHSSQPSTQAYKELVGHISSLAVSALCTEPTGSPAASAVLDFYEMLAKSMLESVTPGYQKVPTILPPSQVVYTLAFSSSSSHLARLCSVLATYKQVFDQGMKASIRYSLSETTRFNGYLMDICNLLWRSRALIRKDPNALGCLCPETVITDLQAYLTSLDNNYSVASTFGLSYNPQLGSMSTAAFRGLEDNTDGSTEELQVRHAGPVTQRSLTLLEKEGGLAISWKRYRIEVLNWLDARGITGVKELMYATMKDLIKANA